MEQETTVRTGPAGTVPADADGQPPAWARWVVGWHVAFWLMLGLGFARLASLTELTAGERELALALLVLLGLAYLPLRRGPGHVSPALGAVYLGTGIAVTGVLCAIHPGLSLLLFILYPQIWAYSDGVRTAIVLTVLLSLSTAAGFMTHGGWTREGALHVAPDMLTSLLFSLLLGLWVTRIIDQSQERAELIGQLEATRSQLAEAHHAQGVMAERERMAREIHDTLAQGFTSIVMLAQAAAAGAQKDPAAVTGRLETIEAVARENLAEARALVAAFAPVGLDGSTLADAVTRLVERFAAETGLEVSVDVSGDLTALDREREVVLLRAVQESLANVRRHARARRVTVRLTADEACARVEVGDDGAGFDAAHRDGFGLAGMRSRVAEAGGEVDVASAPGRGTRVTVRVPAAGAEGAA